MKTATFVIPTFRETDKIRSLMECFRQIADKAIEIIIVNGYPGDETSAWLKENKAFPVIELEGNPSLYWSGLVNVGLRYLQETSDKPRYFFLMNADVKFSTDILQLFLRQIAMEVPCQVAAMTVANGIVLSSGVKVVSWLLTINRHVLAGRHIDSIEKGQLIPVNFLPTRCVMFPYEALEKGGLANETKLPHYGSDYEFTFRLVRLGYPAYVSTDVVVELDVQHTGADVYYKKMGIWRRCVSLFSIKSPSNPVFQMRFIRLTYPRYARPTAYVLYLARAILEIIVGGAILKRYLPMKECGFSGR